MNQTFYGNDPLKRLRVLLVDDEAYMRRVTRTILTAIGIKVVYEAEDGMTGIELARMHLPDLIITDWEMPVVNGETFVQLIRTPGEFPVPDVPIIVLSAHSAQSRVLAAAKIGVSEFICKPVSIRTMRDRIIACAVKRRPTVQLGSYFGPMPRRIVHVESYGNDTLNERERS